MDALNLTIQLNSPLAISQQRNANLIPTLSYIPAPTIRGAIATSLARKSAQKSEFNKAFVEGGLRFSSMLPVYDTSAARVLPAPLSLLSCKQHPGFLHRDKGHGVEDSLIVNTAFALDPENLTGMKQLRFCGYEETDGKCCDNVLKSMRTSLAVDSAGLFHPGPIPGKRLQAHVGLDRERKGSSKGILYTREVINEYDDRAATGFTLFQASVTGSPDLLGWMLEELKANNELLVGNAISRGLGRVEVIQLSAAPALPDVEERITAFNERARNEVLTKGHLIALTLHTPAFFVNAFLMPELSPKSMDLLQAANADEQKHAEVLQMEKVYQNARPFRYTGWNQLAGFPRATEMGLAAGSVMVFEVAELTSSLLEALEHLEKAGIGLRREAGFGNVTVCDPIHTEVHEIMDRKTELA